MIQPHNKQLTMSYYLAAISVSDTIVLSVGNSNPTKLTNAFLPILHWIVLLDKSAVLNWNKWNVIEG